MYKILFVVVLFGLVLQGAIGGPTTLNEEHNASNSTEKDKTSSVTKLNLDDTTTVTTIVSTTTEAVNGASSSEICVLLIQISSLALLTKHLIL